MNTKGGYKCSCMEGYTMDHGNGQRCKANGEEPFLLFANRHDLREIRLESRNYREIVSGLSSAIAMDYDHQHQLLFWSDVTEEKIFFTNLTVSKASKQSGGNFEAVVAKTSTADGIAYDWIHQNLYWTDTGVNKIEVITLDKQYRKTLIEDNLDEPRAIVIDPRPEQG